MVFINTVRTTATLNLTKAESDTEYYMGFLSDIRQLNTAFTRAQSLVVVIGNPLALCRIGQCCSVWKKYIKECEHNGSLYPQGAAYSDFRLDIPTTVLNPQAIAFVPHAYETTSRDDNDSEELSDPLSPSRNLAASLDTSDDDSDDEVAEFNRARDDIILQELRRQMRRDKRRLYSRDNEDVSDSDDTDEESVMATSINMRMVEEDDHVRVEEAEDEAEADIETGQIIPCVFRMSLDGQRMAIPKASEHQMSEITIATNSQRATAMDGDEVLVEILVDNDAQEVTETALNEPPKVYGKVVNIVKRAVDFTDKELVCLADPFSDNLMVPVNRRLPKLVILKGKRNHRRSSGHLIIPICKMVNANRDSAILVKDVVVNNKDRPHKLFVVRWLQWRKEFPYPLGIVTTELPRADKLDEGLSILERMYDVQNHHDRRVSKEISRIYHKGWQIPHAEYDRRRDLRHLVVLTIDPAYSKDLDDALSVEKLTDHTYRVGVHIADVSYFVKRDTDADTKAQKMATSFYPAFGKPIHMLPVELSTDICSLRAGKDRLAISVFFVFEKNGTVLSKQTAIVQSVIHSRIQLTYDDAEDIIASDGHEADDMYESDMKESIVTLSHLAWNHRHRRLGKARYECNLDCMTHPRAHILVEEMMLLTNETVAQYLLSRLPETTPLRRQLPPSLASFRTWKEDNHKFIDQSLHLLHRKEVLQDILKDVDQTYAKDTASDVNTIRVLRDTWQDIKSCTSRDQPNFHRLGGLLSTDKLHPQLAAVNSALQRILPGSQYINSSGKTPEELIHSSLYMALYTHFTSPIRRYIDIVVHRLLVAVINKTKPPHDETELATICHHCNIRCHAAREFEGKTHALELAVKLRQRPKQALAFVEVLTDKGLLVGFSHDQELAEATRKCSVGFSLLKPILKPEVEEGDRSVLITWKERVYHVRGTPMMSPHDQRAHRSRNSNLVVGNSHRKSLEISTHHWQCINQALNEENITDLTEHVQAADCAIQPSSTSTGNQMVQDVTCEIDEDETKKKIYVQFKHLFQIGEVAMLQLYPTFNRGIFTPNVQLFQMTPTLQFCTEHRGQPVQCFSKVADSMPDRRTLDTYRKTWLSIIDMVAAQSAVQANETLILHGVNIDWQHQSKEALPTGSFTLQKTFCDFRNIRIASVLSSGRKAAYLCIRFNSQDSDDQPAMTFVAHAWTWDVRSTEDKNDIDKTTVTVFFEINQMSAPFPKVRGHHAPECTVEIIPLSYPDRYVMSGK